MISPSLARAQRVPSSIPDAPSQVGRIPGLTLPGRIIPDGASRMDCPGAPSRMDHCGWTIPIGPCRRLPFQMGDCDVESVPEGPTMENAMSKSSTRPWHRAIRGCHNGEDHAKFPTMLVNAGNLHDGDNHVKRASRGRAECWRDHARVQK